MKIFIVRHGITSFNKEKIHQFPETSLAEEGKEQADNIARRLKKFSIDKIYVSPLLRACQTAEIIANKLHIPFYIRNELQEIRKPSVIMGKKHTDSEVISIKKELWANYQNTSWYYSDEENFLDIKKRTDSLMKSLQKEYKENINILLVTHEYIAKMIAGITLFGDKLEPKDFLCIYHKLEFSNTGLSCIQYKPTTGFKILFLNDASHLQV